MIRRPKINEEILRAIDKEGGLILFIGAGFSRLCGLPSWDEFADKLLYSCVKEKFIDHSEYDIIRSNSSDAKQKITIAEQYYKKSNKLNDFYKLFKTILEPTNISEDRKKIRDKLLNFIRKTKPFVLTTNADSILHEYYTSEEKFDYDETKISDWTNPSEDKTHLIHLHGYIDRPESLVFTSMGYLNRYSDSDFKAYLNKTIFTKNNTILFIGYGLSEFEVLDYLYLRKSEDTEINKWYVLNGYYGHCEEFSIALDQYYNNLGIKQIKYSLDKNGYDELAYLLDEWIKDILSLSKLNKHIYDTVLEIIERKPTKKRVQSFISFVNYEENPSIARSAFHQVKKSEYSIDWLTCLYNSDSNYFSLEKSGFITNNEGKVVPYEWLAFSTFVKVHQENANDLNLGKISLKLIADLFNYLEDNLELYENHYVISYFNQLLLIQTEYLNSINFHTYLSRILKTKSIHLTSFIYDLVDRKEVIYDLTEKNKLSLYSLITDYCIDNDERKGLSHEYEILTASFMSDFCKVIPVQLFQYVYNKLLEIQKNNQFEFADMGSIYYYPETDYQKSAKGQLIVWLKEVVIYLEPTILTKHFKEIISKEDSINSKLSIYLLNISYRILSSEILELSNQFDNWHKYSDLCVLIECNDSIINDKECNIILEWCLSTNFGKDVEQYTIYVKSCRFEVIKLLMGCTSIEAQTKKRLTDLHNEFYNDEFDEFDHYKDRNKIFKMSSSWASTDKNVLEDLQVLNFKEICSYLANIKFDFNRDLYMCKNAFKEFLIQRPQFIYDNMNNLIEVPKKYHSEIIHFISDSTKEDKMEEDFEILYSLAKYGIENEFDEGNLKSIAWIMSRKNYYKQKPEEVFNLSKIIADYSLKKNDVRKEPIQRPLTYLINNTLYSALSMMIFSAVNKPDKLSKECIQTMNEYLSLNSNNLFVIKSAISSHLNQIIFLDKEWIEDEIDIVFDNRYDGVFFSHVAFSYRLLFSDWAFNKISKYKDSYKFLAMIESDRIEENLIVNFMIWGLSSIYRNQTLNAFTKAVIQQIKPKAIFPFFSQSSNMLEKAISENDTYEINRIISTIKIFVANHILIPLEEDKSYDQVIRYVMKFFDICKKRDRIFLLNYSIHLSKGFDRYLSDEIKEACINLEEGEEAELFAEFILKITEFGNQYAFLYEYDSFEMILDKLVNLRIGENTINNIIENLAKRDPVYYKLGDNE